MANQFAIRHMNGILPFNDGRFRTKCLKTTIDGTNVPRGIDAGRTFASRRPADIFHMDMAAAAISRQSGAMRAFRLNGQIASFDGPSISRVQTA